MDSCVLILNWNGWADTLECLESVFRSDPPCGPVIVCDNDSEDGSLERIRAWAEGRLDLLLPRDGPMRRFSLPPVPKPIPYVVYDRDEAERGGDPRHRDVPLVLIRTGGNLGYAGGNNVGLRYALARGDRERVWLLNNDTVVEPDALRHLAREMDRDPRIGMCGSTLLYYHAPDTVQALGGASYNSWIALPRLIGGSDPVDRAPGASEVLLRLAFVAGASMLVSRRLLEEVGLLSEDYFLYFEELDWALRARGRFVLGYSPSSVVYHKEGRSTGAGVRADRKSRLSEYYFFRNRLAVTRKFFPSRMPTVYIGMLIAILRRASRRQWDRVWLILRLCWWARTGERADHRAEAPFPPVPSTKSMTG